MPTFEKILVACKSILRLCRFPFNTFSSISVPSGFPTITIHPTMRALFEGRDTVMICSADGYPAPTITWLRNDIPVDMGEARFSILPTGGNKHFSTSVHQPAGEGVPQKHLIIMPAVTKI